MNERPKYKFSKMPRWLVDTEFDLLLEEKMKNLQEAYRTGKANPNGSVFSASQMAHLIPDGNK